MKQTTTDSISDTLGARSGLMVAALGLGLLYWIIESAAHVLVLGERTFFQQIVKPDAHELWMRLTVMAMLVAFAAFAAIIVSKQRRAEEAAKLAHAELDQIFQTAADGMRVIDKNFNTIRVNETFAKLCGVSVDQAVGKKCYDVFRGPLCHTPECPLIRILEGQERVECEVKKESNDGSEIPCVLTAIPFRTLSGAIVGVVEDFKDISQLERSEEALRSERDKLELVTRNVGVGLAIISRAYKTIWANKVLKDIFGQVEGKLCYLTYNQRSEICPGCGVKEVFERGADSVTHEQEGKNAGGNTIWSQIISTPIKDKDGNITTALEVVVPITERKQAEEKLKEQLKFQESLMNTLPNPVFYKDNEGKYTGCNKAFEEIIGRPREEIIGKTVYDMGPKEIADKIDEKDRELFQNPGKQSYEWKVRTTIGETREVMFDKATFENADGEVAGLIGVITDITERKRAEEERIRLETQLRQAQKMEAIAILAGGIAHDFNNILGAIIGNAELIQLFDVEQDSKMYSRLEEVLIAGRRARDLVQHILTFSRRTEHDKQPISLASIVKEVIKFLRASLPTTIELRQNISAKEATILGDPTQIHQVIMNLYTNAAHAMGKKGGTLTVEVSNVEIDVNTDGLPAQLEPGPYVRLVVTDTGHGMDKDCMEKMFDPYFTTKKAGEGTGLGLSVVHGIVKSHGGSISVNTEPEKGTVFQIYFPKLERKPAAAERWEKPILPTGSERILFVDDERPLVEAGRDMLQKLGYKVVAKTNGAEALESFIAQPQEFDLVVTDLTMPRMTGVELAKGMKAVRNNIPIILCTGFLEKMTREQFKNTGFCEIIGKPLDVHVLAQTVRRILDENTVE